MKIICEDHSKDTWFYKEMFLKTYTGEGVSGLVSFYKQEIKFLENLLAYRKSAIETNTSNK